MSNMTIAHDVLSDKPVDVSTQFSLAQHSIPNPHVPVLYHGVSLYVLSAGVLPDPYE